MAGADGAGREGAGAGSGTADDALGDAAAGALALETMTTMNLQKVDSGAAYLALAACAQAVSAPCSDW